ncbi:MAG: glutamate racemase [Eubacteriales bacterium]
MNSSPIGVFDSGVGGIALLRDLRRVLPNEDFIYYGDRANAPYGEKSHAEILRLSKNIVNELLSRGAKAIVVACNTATAVAIEPLRAAYPDLPIIGIEPAVKPARMAGCKRVLVLATPVTVREGRFAALLKANSGEGCEFIGVPCPRLAYMIENDKPSDEIEEYMRSVFAPYRADGFDGIVLGCTHYPLAVNEIKSAAGTAVSVFDGADGTARHTKDLLERLSLDSWTRKIGTVEFICSDGTDYLEQFYNKITNR